MGYIDKTKLTEMITFRAKVLVDGKEAFYYIANWIDKLPDADVREVKHGEWIRVDGDVGYEVYKCSLCGEQITVDDEEELPNFCPNCGADMRKEC